MLPVLKSNGSNWSLTCIAYGCYFIVFMHFLNSTMLVCLFLNYRGG